MTSANIGGGLRRGMPRLYVGILVEVL